MQQYWNIKKNYFDSIVCVRFGRWYMVYFYDLLPLNEISETPLNFNYQYHGFHQSEKEKYVEAFLNNGYRVVMVEQTETTDMMVKKNNDLIEQGIAPKKIEYIGRV